MDITYAISSCRAIFDHAFGSQILRILLFSIFVLFPMLKIAATIIRTKRKVDSMNVRPLRKLSSELQSMFGENKLNKSLFLVSSNQHFLAFSTGFFSRKIVISTFLLKNFTVKEIEAIVLHELYHVRAFHALFLFISELCMHFFFYFPFFQDIHLQIRARFEMSADAYATKVQQTKQHIKSSLKKALLFDSSLRFLPQFSYQIIDQRIDTLNSQKRRFTVNPFRLTTSFFVFVLFLTVFLLNKRYAMASVMEETISCGLFDCVRNCMAYELTKQPQMSEVNYSFER